MTRIILYCCAGVIILYILLFTGITAKEQNTVIQITPTGKFGYFNFFNIIITISVFILCKSICNKKTFASSFKEKAAHIAELTFGIYLMHELVIHFLGKYIKYYLQPGFLYTPVISIAIFAFSAMLIFLVRKISIFRDYIV